jgi:glycosyltransferase involved in cell wall biosynthesis
VPEGLTILQVIPRMRAGGAELGCLQIAEALVKAGNRAIVASEGGRLVEVLEKAGGEHRQIPAATKNPLQLISNAKALADIIRAEKVDIIHARSRAPAWSALWAARKTGIAFVTTYHGEYREQNKIKNLYNSVMARSDKVIAVSDNIARLIAQRYGTPASRIATIHRAYDPQKFDTVKITKDQIDRVRSQFSVPGSSRILLLAGRVSPNKAHVDLIEAVSRLPEQLKQNFVLVFPGEIEKPDYAEGLKSRAKTLGVEIRLPGHTDNVAEVMAASAALFNISRTEGLPRVVIEAQAMGIPVVVSDSGPGREVALTPPDVAIERATGLRVPYADPNALAAVIKTLFEMTDDARKQMGLRGKALVQARYTLDRMTASTLAVYDEVYAAKRINKDEA